MEVGDCMVGFAVAWWDFVYVVLRSFGFCGVVGVWVIFV